MAVKFRIDAVEKITSVEVRNDLTLPEQKREIAQFVQVGIDEAKATNKSILGRVPPFTVTVDGHEGAPLESVNPDGGSIIVEFELVGDVLIWIGQTLRERSPIVSGAYRDAHTLYADGQEVPKGEVAPSADEYVFLNPLPYARKIEIGKTKAGRDFVIQVENRIYERTAKDAQSRYGNIGKVTFSYRAPFGGSFFEISRIGPLQVKRDSRGRFLKGSGVRAGNQQERALRVPAIIVNLGKE